MQGYDVEIHKEDMRTQAFPHHFWLIVEHRHQRHGSFLNLEVRLKRGGKRLERLFTVISMDIQGGIRIENRSYFTKVSQLDKPMQHFNAGPQTSMRGVN